MFKACKMNKQEVIKAIEEGNIDAADISYPNFIDDIILEMANMNLIYTFDEVLEDKRASKNSTIPLNIIITLSLTAKMKQMTSLFDIPFAITDCDTLAKLGWNLYSTDRDNKKGLISCGGIRNLINHYQAQDFVNFYNNYAQVTLEDLNYDPALHILDCTKVDVNVDNDNYENSTVINDDGDLRRGYKIASLRGLIDTEGVMEEIEIGTMKTHDLNLSKDILLNSPALKPGDKIINDKGFLSREIMNKLKTEREVDTYIPVRKNMKIYKEAVSIAKNKEEKDWNKHPQRKNQIVTSVSKVSDFWKSDNPDQDVKLNTCVVYDKKDDEYFVFVTTNLDETARQVIKTYELRPEIEEDFRQLKEFWQLEEFKSTKYDHIVFHIVMLLMGYMFYQLYKNTEAGSEYAHKSLPTILKKYEPEDKPKKIIIYTDNYFGMFSFPEFLDIYVSCSEKIRKDLKEILDMI
ncbi:MAG: transposase [Halanaerobiales bacterium]|nr:transposase [Halanaerobiales bacterium]